MLQSVFTELSDVLPADFFNIESGGGGGGEGGRGERNSCDNLGKKHAIFRLFQGILIRIVVRKSLNIPLTLPLPGRGGIRPTQKGFPH